MVVVVAVMVTVVMWAVLSLRGDCRTGEQNDRDGSEQHSTKGHVWSPRRTFLGRSLHSRVRCPGLFVRKDFNNSARAPRLVLGRRLLRGRGDVDEDEVIFDAKRVDGYGRVFRGLGDASVKIEGPGVPGAEDGIAFDPAFCKGSLAMGTDIVERVKLPMQAGETDGCTCGVEFRDGAFGGAIADGAEGDPMGQR